MVLPAPGSTAERWVVHVLGICSKSFTFCVPSVVVPAPGSTAKCWVRVFIFLLLDASGMRLSVASLLEAFIDGSYLAERAQPTPPLLVPLVLVLSFL